MVYLSYMLYNFDFIFFTGNGDCPPGHLDIGSKCFWFLCEDKELIRRYPDIRCALDLSDLASVDSNAIKPLGQYLNTIEIKKAEFVQVTLGLSRNNEMWLWQDGTVYNDSIGTLGYKNNFGVLVWNKATKKWSLKGARYIIDDLHLCERKRSM